ncbi:hypothetical protein Ssi03_25920 [Sphaerisporangium siamense]|uniref:Phage-related minor tail protein n=1 Tax=Sphaerisporangium siamense TaxID=795645 RepID=A0A7W7D4R9_9ACTN|nr:phage tail tape measure protein [Sphaerisporangium siamense]MBB4700081.1 phage-related minor tail protein [Sphaerisporangium siamense]GII84602.1 hypothetical protein Ssi03_25920 [Sphaerisporangium siamense]
MALKVGDLVAFMELDNKGFTSGAAQVDQTMNRLQSGATRTTGAIERDVVQSFARVADAIARGVDPDEALRDLDRLVAGFDSGMTEMVADAGTGGQRVVSELRNALDQVEDEARRAGRDAGAGLADGLEDGLGDTSSAARRHGQDAGEALGEGTESSGRSRMSGAMSGLMSGLKAAPWLAAAAAAGAAIGGALMSGLESAMEAEKAKKKLFAQVGAFGDDAGKLGKVAGAVYADAYGESMGDVTDAIKSVVQNMDGMNKAGEESLTGVTKRAMDVATIMDEDVSSVTRAVSQILRTDLAPNAEAAFDLIVKGTQLGLNKSEDLLDSYNEYATQFRSIGLDGQTALGLISQGLKAGARDADVVTDTIKEFALEAVKGGDNVKKGFTDLGLNADAMVAKFAAGGPTAAKAFDTVLDKLRGIEDPAKRNAVAVELFGTKAEDMAGALYALDPSKAVESLGQVDGAAKNAGDTLQDTASNKVEAFKRGLEQNVTNFIGEKVLPALEELWKGFEGSGLSETLSGVRDKAGEVFGGIVDDIKQWASDNEETLDGIRDRFSDIFEEIGETVDSALELIQEVWDEWGDEIMEVVTFVLDHVGALIEGALQTIKGIFKTITGMIKGDWSKVWEGLGDIVDGATKGIRNIINDVMRAILKSWGLDWDEIKKTVRKKIDDVVKFVEDLPDNLKKIFKDAKNWLLNAGKAVIDGLIGGIKSKVKELGDNLAQITQFIKDNKGPIDKDRVLLEPAGRAIIDGLIAGMRGSEDKLKGALETLTGIIKDGFGKTPKSDPLVDFITANTTKLSKLADEREAILKRIADAKEYAKQIEQSAKDFAKLTGIEDPTSASDLTSGLKDRLQQMKDFAKNIQELAKRGLNKTILKQIIDAGVEGGGSLAEMLVGADDSEIKALNKAQKQIDSMSKKLGKIGADALYDTGKKAGTGYLKGLEDSLKKLDATMKKIVDALVKAIKKELKIKSPSQVMAEIGEQTIDGLPVGFDKAAPRMLDRLKLIGKDIGDQVAATAQAAISGSAYQARPEEAQLKRLLGGAKFGLAVEGLQPERGGGGSGSVPPAAPTGGGDPYSSPQDAVGGKPSVVVNMPNAVMREEADAQRLGNEFGFKYLATP